MEKKLFEGIAFTYSSQGEVFRTMAASREEAARNIRIQFNKAMGRSPHAYVRIEEVKEIKKKN